MDLNKQRIGAYLRGAGKGSSEPDADAERTKKPALGKHTADHDKHDHQENTKSREKLDPREIARSSRMRTGPKNGEPLPKGLAKVPIKEDPHKSLDKSTDKPLEKPHVSSAAKPTRQEIARYLVLIGTEEAASILSHLEETEVEALVKEIGSIGHINAEEAAVTLDRFQGFVSTGAVSPASGGVETARGILRQAFGKEKGDTFLHQALPQTEQPFFSFLHELDPGQVLLLLRPESAAVKTIVLAWLPPPLAAGVLKQLGPIEQKQVITRLAAMQRIDRDVLQRIDQALRDRMRDTARSVNEEVDGRTSLAGIMRHLDPSLEQELLDALGESEPDLAQEIRDRLFTIDTLLLVEDRDLQKVLGNMSDQVIALILKGKSEEIRKKILSNVSETRATQINQEYQYLGPKPRREVDQATRDFISVLRQLETDGQIRIRRDDEEYI